MDQNENGLLGEPDVDALQFTLEVHDADLIFTTATTIDAGNTIYDGYHILIDGAMVTIDGPHNFASMQLIRGAKLTHAAGFPLGMNLTVTTDLIVGSSSSITSDGKGHGSGLGPGAGQKASTGGGGGYGGGGGNGHMGLRKLSRISSDQQLDDGKS